MELEGRFLAEMTAARLNPQRDRLETVARYAERNFYVRAKALLAILLVSNWRWPAIEGRLEQEIESVAALHAGHPLARDISLGDTTVEACIAQCIRRSSEWHQVLRHIHQIRNANLSRQKLLHFLGSWAAGASTSGESPAARDNTGPNAPDVTASPASQVSAVPAVRQGRGRPPKFSNAQFEEVQRRTDAGESHRVASTVFNGKASPTPGRWPESA